MRSGGRGTDDQDKSSADQEKAPRKVTELQQQLILGGLILALAVGGMWSYWNSLSAKIGSLQRTKAAAEARIREQDNMLKEVKSVEDERKRVNDKIAIIEQLKKNQGLLVHLLDEVSKALPQGVNLTSLSERSGQINLEGMAFTNNDIVRLVANLKASPYCSDVFLQESAQSSVEGIDV
ncbi:MAG TPA: PilN domain-containing protein, partial [Nitrospirota bacterium]|nr:PilN domain-containing protein [Nitrospirota bacterium]